MQTTYLQLTLFEDGNQGRSATKYSLGSRLSVEPVWELIRACEWQLRKIIDGLNSMDFSSNVRDNSLLQAHTDVTVRKFFSKERALVAPADLGSLPPLRDEPTTWQGLHLMQLLANHQYRQFRASTATPGQGNANALLLDIIEEPECWLGQRHDGKLHICRRDQTAVIQSHASLLPDFREPAPRLLPRRSHLNPGTATGYSGN